MSHVADVSSRRLCITGCCTLRSVADPPPFSLRRQMRRLSCSRLSHDDSLSDHFVVDQHFVFVFVTCKRTKIPFKLDRQSPEMISHEGRTRTSYCRRCVKEQRRVERRRKEIEWEEIH